MRRILSKISVVVLVLMTSSLLVMAQDTDSLKAQSADTARAAGVADAAAADTAALSADLADLDEEPQSLHQVLKTKFIEGSAGFMSLVALALVLGLAFCIERIIYLALSEIDAKKMMKEIDAKLAAGDVEGAKALCEAKR